MNRIALVAAALAACVDSGPGPAGKKIDASFVARNLVAAVPADIARLDVALGTAAAYVGNRVDHEQIAPGGSVKITHYWQVLVPPGPGWRVFAFVRGLPNTADFMSLPATDMEVGHPVDTWKSGEIVQDAQDIVLRADWKSAKATVYVGLIETGGHQLGDRMGASGNHVVDRAIVAHTFDVDLSKAPPPPGTIYVPHAAGLITIDGVANDSGWASAVTSPEFVTAEGSPDPIGRATAKMTWDEQNLYLFVSIADTDIYSPYKNHDDTLWKADDIEIFIDADGNRRGYVELQVNPNNATFDSWFRATKAEGGDPSWESGMVTAVKVRGTPDVAGDSDQGWDAEIAIPLAAVKGKDDAMKVRLPPEVGDRWRMNVVRVDGGSRVSSWNRITYQDFHALDRMLTIVFADRTGSIVPTPTPTPTPIPNPTPNPTPTPTPTPVSPTTPPGGAHAAGSAKAP